MVFVFTIVLLVLIAQSPHEVLVLTCVIYAASGPASWLYRTRFKNAKKEKEERMDQKEKEESGAAE